MTFAVVVALAAILVPSLIILFAYLSERWQAWRRGPALGWPHHGARR